jgi:hypothetical protein
MEAGRIKAESSKLKTQSSNYPAKVPSVDFNIGALNFDL